MSDIMSNSLTMRDRASGVYTELTSCQTIHPKKSLWISVCSVAPCKFFSLYFWQ